MKTTVKIFAMAALLTISSATYAQLGGLVSAVKDSKKEKEAKKEQELAAAKEAERAKAEGETKTKIKELVEKGDAAEKAYKYEEAIAIYDEAAKLNETVEKKDYKSQDFVWAIQELKNRVDLQTKMIAAYDAKQWPEFLKLATDTRYGFGSAGYNGSKNVWREGIPADMKAKIDVAEEEAKWICAYYKPDLKYTNDFHAKNIGKILFAKQEIKSEDNNPVLADNFTLKDDIYAHFYLKTDFHNECFSIGFCDSAIPDWYTHLRITVDGKASDVEHKDYNQTSDKSEFGATLTADVQKKRSFQGNYSTESQQYQWLWEFFYYLPAGTHKIKIERIFDIPEGGKDNKPRYQEKFGKERVLAAGEFSIAISAADKLAFSNKMCIPLGQVGIEDAAVLARFKKEAGAGALKVWITSNDWSYDRNVYGVVTKRSIYGQAISKDPKTGKYVLQEIGLYQEAAGNTFSNGTTAQTFLNHIPAEWVK